MPIKTILVPMTDAEGAAETLASAFALAADFDAHVAALFVRTEPTRVLIGYAGETMSPALVDQVMTESETRAAADLAAVRKAFDAAAAKADARTGRTKGRAGARAGANRGVTASFAEVTGDTDYIIEERGRLADLIVVRRARDVRDASARLVAEGALMGSARPVLVLPPKTGARVGQSVAIAWNGSREAARAVGAAIPFLARAAGVTVITATDGAAVDQKGLVEYLGRHGVKAKAVKVKPGKDTGKAIVGAAVKTRANLLVMGAYTHSRVRELIFGGVTEHALGSARLPVLMIH